MIFSFVFSFILILLITFLAVGVSGGSLLYILDLPSFAGELFISIETVKSHMNSIFEKLSISSRKELVLWGNTNS